MVVPHVRSMHSKPWTYLVTSADSRTSAALRGDRPASSRGKAATLHVDLGEELKSAVRAAADRAGMRPSDWVRSQLAAAVDGGEVSGAEPKEPVEAQSNYSSGSTSPDLFASARIHQLTLQPEDIDQLDRVAAAGGFRSRPAALRFLLRAHDSAEGRAALRRLPETLPALIEGNVTLQSAVRLAAGFSSLDPSAPPCGLDSSTRREISVHMERASRVVAALLPLLAPRR